MKTPHEKALGKAKGEKKILATGKIERDGEWNGKPVYKASVKTKKGEYSGKALQRHHALGNALYDSKNK